MNEDTQTRDRRYVAFLRLMIIGNAGILIAAGIMEGVFGVYVCPLCRMQQGVYWLLLLVNGIYYWLYRRPYRLNKWWQFALNIILSLIGLGLSWWSVGVEYGWLPVPKFCTSYNIVSLLNAQEAVNLQELTTQMMAKPSVGCDKVQVRILGLSLAEINVMIMLVSTGVNWWLGKYFLAKRQ